MGNRQVRMSMEAQFYEARRRQNWIERRRSLRADNELHQVRNLVQPFAHRSFKLNIPVRIIQQDSKPRERCTCMPMQRTILTRSDQSLFQRDRDIYPRPAPLANNLRRTKRNGKLTRRFSSIEYLQQW